MTTTYEAFLPYVLPLVPNCPEPTAVLAIRNACIDFCRGSLLLEQALDPITSIAGVSEYDIDVPTGYKLAQVQQLYFNGNRLARRSLSEVASRYSRDWALLSGTPQAWTQFTPDMVILVPMPSTTTANAITGTIAITPSRDSAGVDDTVFERYVEQIAHGAAARLCNVPNQPFTDPNAALLYTKQFNSDVANVRALVSSGQNRAPLKVLFTRV